MVIIDFISKIWHGDGKVAGYRFEGAPQAVALYLPAGKFLTLRVVV